MLIELSDLVQKHDMKITGVLHVGAHTGEEAVKYHALDVHNVWWVEANTDIIPELTANVARFGHRVINALVTNVEGELTPFNVTNNVQSSSILELGTHRKSSPDVHYVAKQHHLSRTIDSLISEYGIRDCNLWNFDIQGAELLALKGAAENLAMADYMYLEVNRGYVYQGNGLIGELDQFLADFERTDTEWSGYGLGEWGDALWVRRSCAHAKTRVLVAVDGRRVIACKKCGQVLQDPA